MAFSINDSQTSRWIDVHHHIVPEHYVSALNYRGIKAAHGGGHPKWSPELSLETMDKNGIASVLTSLSSPGVYFGDAAFAGDMARQCNEYSAQMVSDNLTRFGFFATLPMPATEAAVREATYALDTLKADGVVLLASAGGKFLGDSDFEELMAELNARKAVVFIHPNIHLTSEQLGLNIPGFYIEFLFDTTQAVTNLIFTGTVERYPDIRWILAHAGGAIPYIAWRLSLANLDPSTIEKAPRGALAYLRSFYYETALSPSPYAISALLNLVSTSPILFGSDYPYAPRPLVAKEISDLQQLEMVDEATQKAIARENALTLFPRLKEKTESLPPPHSSGSRDQKRIALSARIAISLMRKVMGA